jgi:CRP-like cAMP-binding protein
MTAELAEFPVFEGLTQEHLAQIESRCQPITIERGGTIFRAGESAEFLFLVQSGQAELRFGVQCYGAAREIPLDFAVEGDVFGWSSLFPPFTYTLTARASQDSTLLKINRPALQACCEADPRLGYVVMQNIAATIGKRYHRMRETLGREIQVGITRRDPLA